MSGSEKCQDCGKSGGRPFVFWMFQSPGELSEQTRRTLCQGCRKSLTSPKDSSRKSERHRFLAALDVFFRESGVLEICARCHAQGTGCCPSSCRRLTSSGCREKILWCGTFLCSAMLGALRECSPEVAGTFAWLKKEIGTSEWRLFELVSRMSASGHDVDRHIGGSTRFPTLPILANGSAFRLKLRAMGDEILEIRRAQFSSESLNVPGKSAGNCF